MGVSTVEKVVKNGVLVFDKSEEKTIPLESIRVAR